MERREALSDPWRKERKKVGTGKRDDDKERMIEGGQMGTGKRNDNKERMIEGE